MAESSQLLPGRTRKATIVAQDPGVRDGSRVLMAEVDIPAERLSPGPRGHRLHVIDYDASTDTLYRPYNPETHRPDLFEDIDFEQMLVDPHFQSWNVYASSMRTLGRFEFALGRKVEWNLPGHQLKAFPHAFRDPNAFYSPESEALMFGYFQGEDNVIFSCLTHDVIAHETTHAVIDGLRPGFTDPSSLDQGAFHEGFADVVALLEVLALPEIVRAILERSWRHTNDIGLAEHVARQRVTEDRLLTTELFGLADEMGKELVKSRGDALRRSVLLAPLTDWRDRVEWLEPHRRGEILSAVMLRAFVKVWTERLGRLRRLKHGSYDLGSVAEEGSEAASQLLVTAMRAIDYTPPIHLTFSDYLSALLTADYELKPEIDKYNYRAHLLESFKLFGIQPASDANQQTGRWERHVDRIGEPPDSNRSRGRGTKDPSNDALDYNRSRYEGMQRDPEEVFRFVWENRRPLGLVDDAYTAVRSIRPAIRVAAEDGAVVRETVVDVEQQIALFGRELSDFGVSRPTGMLADQRVVLKGGATLIFDDYGRLKYRVKNALPLPRSDRRHQPAIADLHSVRVRHLWESGYIDERGHGRGAERLREIHLRRAIDDEVTRKEQW